MLATETPGIWLLASRTKENFGRQNVLFSRPIQFLESSAHFDLRLTIGVHFSAVKKVDTGIPGSLGLLAIAARLDNITYLETFLHNITFLSTSVRQPAAQ